MLQPAASISPITIRRLTMTLEQIVYRISKDPQFADNFIADPRAVLESGAFEIEEGEMKALFRTLEAYHKGGVSKATGAINWLAPQFGTSKT
jgi:hypothetical protein